MSSNLSKKIEGSSKYIREVFSYNYVIPFFQRGYAWQEDELKEFWNDLTVTEKKAEELFLGSIVLRKIGKDFFEVIDGQQRLTTITIFLCVVRDIFIENNFMDEATTIDEYISKTNNLKKKKQYKLTLGEDDGEFFEKFIQLPANHEERKNKEQYKSLPSKKLILSNRYLYEAYTFFAEKIKNEYGDINELKKRCSDLIEDVIMDNFTIVQIIADEDVDAYLIFETMNNRGKDLNDLELLKSYIFSKSSLHNENDVRTKWRLITNKIYEMKDQSAFLRHYWIGYHSVIQPNKLYNEIKSFLSTSDIEAFLNSLDENAQIYLNILYPEEKFWGGTNMVEQIKNVSSYTSTYPLIMAAKTSLDEKVLEKVLKITENFSLQYYICGHNTGTLVSIFEKASKIVRKETNDCFDSLRELYKSYVSKEVFELEFSKRTIKDAPKQRYILEKLMQYNGTDELKASNPKKVNVEHIAPVTPNEVWLEQFKGREDEYESLLNRIGNLTLLSGKLNRKILNQEFAKKKKEYENSEINLTKALLEYEHWDAKEINERQAMFAKQATEIWKI